MEFEDKSISFVIPAYKSEETLHDCLASIRNSDAGASEILVIFSNPSSAEVEIALKFESFILEVCGPPGAALARNTGVRAANSSLVMLVDADVIIDSSAPSIAMRILEQYNADAVVGSFVPGLSAPGVVASLKNLHLSWTHSQSEGATNSLASAIALVKRNVYLAVGGFDPELRYCDDIEFGARCSKNGYSIVFSSAIKAIHLKSYNLTTWARSELFGRAVPWWELIIERRVPFGVLNTKPGQTISVIATAVFIASIILIPYVQSAFWVSVTALLIILGSNLRFIAFTYQHKGLYYALLVPMYLFAYYILCILGVMIGSWRGLRRVISMYI